MRVVGHFADFGKGPFRVNVLKSTVAALIGLATTGAIVICMAEDPAGTSAKQEATTSKPPQVAWEKAIAAWKAQKVSEPADNSYCDVCHLNYQEEKLAKTHKRAGVGCETCHGISDKHSEDEDNVIRPDIMYAKAQVMPFCMGCHKKEKLLKEDEHEDLFSNSAAPKDTCTDCHGEKHRLKVRTRRWNKETGKLIWSDGVRMMQKNK